MTRAVLPVVFGVILLHAGLHLVWLRRLARFTEERTMMRYHLGLAALVGCGLLLLIAREPSVGALVASAGAVALVGLYSLSFLELWALADGGYSISILRYLAARGGATPEASLVDHFADLGHRKQIGRFQSLCRFGWVLEGNRGWSVTHRGRLVARAARGLIWLCAVEERG